MNDIVLDFLYLSQFWSSKLPIPNGVENFAENWVFCPGKNGEGPPKTKTYVSENPLCNIYPQ